MSLRESRSFQCPKCQCEYVVEVWQSINVTEEPEGRNLLLDGNINVFSCSNCGYQALISVPLMYHDMELEFCVQFYPFEFIEREEVLMQFERDGSINVDAFKGLPLPEYMRTRHIVFHMDELIRYILFREKIADYYH